MPDMPPCRRFLLPPPPPPPFPPKNSIRTYSFVPELLVAKGDINNYLHKIRMAGAHGIRFFLLQSWSTNRLVPWLQATYNGQGVWVDIPSEGVHAPVSDLNAPNTMYWSRLSEILALIKANDLEAIVSLGDNCSMNTHQQFFSYPFLGGLQTMSREEGWPYVVPQEALGMFTASRGGLYGPDKYPYFQKWIVDAITAFHAANMYEDVHFEMQNEFSKLGWTDDTPAKWYQMCLSAAGYGNEVNSYNSGDYSIISQHEGIYSLHGVAKPTFETIPGMDKTRTMLSGDGAQGNSTTDIDVCGRQGLSVEDAQSLAAIIRADGWWGIELMNKALWRDDDNNADVTYATTECIEAFK